MSRFFVAVWFFWVVSSAFAGGDPFNPVAYFNQFGNYTGATEVTRFQYTMQLPAPADVQTGTYEARMEYNSSGSWVMGTRLFIITKTAGGVLTCQIPSGTVTQSNQVDWWAANGAGPIANKYGVSHQVRVSIYNSASTLLNSQTVGTVTARQVLGGGPAAGNYVVPLPFTVTMDGQCPKREEGGTFEVAGSLISAAKAHLSLRINGTEVFGVDVAGGPLDQPLPFHQVKEVKPLPGDYFYEWYLGNTLLASGGLECGEHADGPHQDNVGVINFTGPFVEEPQPPKDEPDVNNNPPPTNPPPPPPEGNVNPPPSTGPDSGNSETGGGSGSNGGSVTAKPPSTAPAPQPTPPPAPPPPNPYSPGGPGGDTKTPDMTKDDFYQSMREAMNDALKQNSPWLGGGSGEQPGDTHQDSLGNAAKFRVPPDSSVRESESSVSQALGQIKDSQASAMQRAQATATVFSAAYERASHVVLPSGNAGNTLEGFKVLFRGTEYPVNLSAYQSAVSWVRQIMVLIVTYTFWRLQIKIVMEGTKA